MLSINIPKIVRKSSVSLSPVSSLVQKFHEAPKEFYKQSLKPTVSTDSN